MGAYTDHSGKTFGRLFVVKRIGGRGGRYECKCSCGNSVDVDGGNLVTGNTKSCGCWNSHVRRTQFTTHGKTGTREHRIWRGMLSRCSNSNIPDYRYYGGRGITVCKRWRNSFSAFLEDMGESNGMTLDRINNDKGYSKSNCRWASRKDQARNSSQSERIDVDGHPVLACELREKNGISRGTYKARVRRGWSRIEAATKPPRR